MRQVLTRGVGVCVFEGGALLRLTLVVGSTKETYSRLMHHLGQ